jgi:hypothetical protein
MAILTNTFKRDTIGFIKDDFDNNSNHYHIGIGRSEEWNSTDTLIPAENTDYEERLFRNSLQSVKKVADTDATFVIERYNWTSGAKYSAYSDKQAVLPNNPYYVMNDQNDVFVCVQNNKIDGDIQNSTVQPTLPSSNPYNIFETSDGYAWRFLYSISAADVSKFVAANFLPVKLVGTAGNATETQQKAAQDAAVSGQILGYEVVSGGVGYSGTVTLTVEGDGSGAVATATLSGGAISKVEVTNIGTPANLGTGYTNATVKITGGTPSTDAVIRPIFAPKGGLGNDPRVDLRSSAIMFVVKPDGADGSGDFIIGNDFRQVGLIRNITSNGSAVFTGITGIALRKLELGGTPNPAFSVDEIITDQTTGAKAVVDAISSNGETLTFHQNDTTGYGTFNAGNSVRGGDGGVGTIATSSHITAAEVDTSTGDLLYIDNRAAVTRSADQTEDIKIVIQL